MDVCKCLKYRCVAAFSTRISRKSIEIDSVLCESMDEHEKVLKQTHSVCPLALQRAYVLQSNVPRARTVDHQSDAIAFNKSSRTTMRQCVNALSIFPPKICLSATARGPSPTTRDPSPNTRAPSQRPEAPAQLPETQAQQSETPAQLPKTPALLPETPAHCQRPHRP